MSLADILKLILLCHLLLALCFLIFKVLRSGLAKTSFSLSYGQWNRVGRVLILACLLAPGLVCQLPEKNLPRIELTNVISFAGEDAVAPMANDQQDPRRRPLQSVGSRGRAQGVLSQVYSWLATNALAVMAGAHAIVCLVMAMRLFFNLRRLRQLLSSSVVMKKLGPIRIAASILTTIPFSVRLPRTRWVVLPADLLESPADVKIAIRHELQHHRSGDTDWAMLMEILLCLFFPNPAIFLWKRELTELQEFSCDETLLSQSRVSPYEYGSCLVRVAEAALGKQQMCVGTTHMALLSKNPEKLKSFLRRRIEMLMSQERPRRSRWAGALIGTVSVSFVVALAFASEQSLREKQDLKPNPGEVVVDAAIQAIAETALNEAVQAQNAKGGFAIVADPNTGRILAVANVDKTHEKTGYWSLSQVLEPASIAKPLVAAQAIESGLTTPDERHDCENGAYRFGQRIYHDWKKDGWDTLSTTETIVNSSNICAIKIAKKVGAQGIKDMLLAFGFGPGGTAKEFPTAQPGQLPSDVSPRIVPHVAAGFGFRVTPLELVQAYGAIANGGRLLMPLAANQEAKSTGQLLRQVLSRDTSDKMKEILRQVVLNGTGKPARSALYSTAGKTATSFVPDLTKSFLADGGQKGNFAGFIGFAPVKEPKVEVYVGIHDPNTDKTGAHGSTHAAPVFKRITEEVLRHMKVAPDL